MTEHPRFSGRLDAAEQREFVPFCKQLAAASRTIVKGYFLQSPAVDLKDDDSPVTVADRCAEAAMRDLIRQCYPDHGVHGEEYGLDQPDARYRWVLDPIDGTKAFISNCFNFGTLIALLRDGEPILGAIASPLTGHLLIGLGGGQTLLGERTMQTRDCRRIEDATVLTTSHWEMRDRPDGARFEVLSRRAKLYRTWGDCHGYFQIATGGADVMLDPALKTWDIMALVPVIEGAGGRVTGIDGGNPLCATDLLATGGALHDEIVARLAG